MTNTTESAMHLSPPAPFATASVHPRPRRVLRALGDEIHFHLTGADTGGQYSMFTVTTQPGGGPPPHVHEYEDEWFHVLEGRVAFFSNGAWSEVGPGGSAFLPRGVAHTFKNLGDSPSIMLAHTAPSGFEIFFEELAAVCASVEQPDMPRVVATAARHGISFLS